MSESENQPEQADKKRKPRGPSKFIVLKYEGDCGLYSMPVDGAKTINECRERITKKKIVGTLIIACVHRSGETKVQEVSDVVGL